MTLPLSSCWRGSDLDVISTLTNHQSHLQTVRQDYEGLWRDIVDQLNFNRFNFLQDRQKGQKANTLVYDGSPVTAWKLLSAGILGNTLTQSQRWFSLSIPNVITFPRTSTLRKYNGRIDQIPQVKVHLEDKEDQLYAAFNNSNFYSEAYMMIGDASSIGTAVLYGEDDLSRRKSTFLCMNPGECYIAENRFGEVDTMFRKFAMTARAASQMFPADRMEPGLLRSVQESPYTLYNFIHACFPRDDIEMYFSKNGQMIPKQGVNNSKWVSIYIQGGNAASTSNTPSTGGVGTKVLKKSGYDYNPFITWRWTKNSEETYGRSPAMDAIVDIMKLNVIGKTMLHAAQIAVEPPMLVHEKFRNRLRLGPRGRTYYTGNENQEMIKPVQMNVNYQIGLDREARIQKIIEQHFMTDYFVMLWKAALEGSQLSVPQVLEMQGEKASVMMPMMERMIFDFLNPLIDVTDGIEQNAGRMPEPSDFVKEVLAPFAGTRMPVQYNGPLAVAQKRWAKAQGVMQGIEMLGPLVQMFGPEVLDPIDPTATAMDVLEHSGWPAKGIRTAEEIMKVRQGRAQAQAQAHDEGKAEKLLQNAAGLSKMVETLGGAGAAQQLVGGGGQPEGNA